MEKSKKIGMWIVMGIIFVGLFGWLTMLLWNWLIPSLFMGPVITFWQALGLLLLSKILFSGIGGKHCRHYNTDSRKHPWYDRFAHLTPEEREAFKNKIREKWCTRREDSSDRKSDTSDQ